MNETKEDRFRRVAAARVNKIIKMIRLLGNCSNKSTYMYSQHEVDKVFSALHEELEEAEKRFAEAKENERPIFTLEEECADDPAA